MKNSQFPISPDARSGSRSRRDNSQFNRRGATILEGLIVVAILAIIFTILAVIFVGQGTFFQRENARLDSALDNTRALNDLLMQSREAVGVMVTSSIDSVLYTSGPEQLILKLYSLNAAGAFIPSSFDYAVYYRDAAHPNKLMKKVAPALASSRTAVTKCLDNNVSALSFSYNSPDFNQVNQITVYLETAKMAAGTNFVTSSTVRTMLRNK